MGHRLFLVLAALALTLAALASSLRPDAFLVGDPGVKLIAARQALATPGSPLRVALPRLGAEPVPHVEPFFRVHGTHAHAVTSELFPLVSALPLRLFGMRGLYVWPAVSFLAVLASTAWLARVLDPERDPVVVVLVAAFGTPWLPYALEFWEHTPALAAGTTGLALLLHAARAHRGTRGPTAPALAAGLFFGLAVLLRPESGWFVLAALVASRLLVDRPSWRSLMLASAGAAIAVAPSPLYALLHTGSPVPPHIAANAGLMGGHWLETRLHLARVWLAPSAWTMRGPVNAASLWSVATAAVLAVASAAASTDRRERGFLWLLAALNTAMVWLTAPNDGGGQWGPRYLLFTYVPLAILAADAVQLAWARERRPRAGASTPRQAAAIGVAIVFVAATVWVDRAAYRQVRGTKLMYGRLVDFVAASTTRDHQVVTDVWWLDQLGAAAIGDENVLYAGDPATGKAILSRLSSMTVPTVTVFRSTETDPAADSWSAETCYFEESRATLDVRGLVAIKLTHRCGYKP